MLGSSGAQLAAIWRDGAQDWAGLIHIAPAAEQGTLNWRVGQRIKLPTRGHGVQRLPNGDLLFAARRPGDWLVRWQAATDTATWAWMEDDRCFNGHVVLAGAATAQAQSGRSGVVFTTETDLENSQGCIGLRDAASLEKIGEWRTHGMDPHELLVLPTAVGALPAGTLIVANGGIPTQSETGRSKKWLSQMDPSLVALHPQDGRLLGQWRLPDPRLSIRHLAWDAHRQLLGIALQAEHDDARRQRAPIFALWNGKTLTLGQGQPDLAGYGGSVEVAPNMAENAAADSADALGGFVVSCPKSDCTAWFDTRGRFVRTVAQADVCPLALDGRTLWSGGGHGVGAQGASAAWQSARTADAVQALQFDNHWRLV